MAKNLKLSFYKRKKGKKNLPKWKTLKRKSIFDLKIGKRPTSHRSTTYLCYVPILEEFAGAGRVGLASAKVNNFYFFARE